MCKGAGCLASLEWQSTTCLCRCDGETNHQQRVGIVTPGRGKYQSRFALVGKRASDRLPDTSIGRRQRAVLATCHNVIQVDVVGRGLQSSSKGCDSLVGDGRRGSGTALVKGEGVRVASNQAWRRWVRYLEITTSASRRAGLKQDAGASSNAKDALLNKRAVKDGGLVGLPEGNTRATIQQKTGIEGIAAWCRCWGCSRCRSGCRSSCRCGSRSVGGCRGGRGTARSSWRCGS